MRLLLTRAGEDIPALTKKLAALGHQTLAMPVLHINYDTPAHLPEMQKGDAFAFTSVNGVRALQNKTASDFPDTFPAYAVGAATAAACRAFGFATIYEADGDVEALAKIIKAHPPRGKLVHIAGQDLAGDLAGALTQSSAKRGTKGGIRFSRAVLYHAQAATHIPDAIADELRAGKIDGVLIYSPRSAEIFIRLCKPPKEPEEAAEGLMVAAQKLTGFCLSKNVADVMRRAGFDDCRIAAAPTEKALLHLLETPKISL